MSVADDMAARGPPTAFVPRRDYDSHDANRQARTMKTIPMLLALAAALTLAACDRDGGTVGQKVDTAVAKTQQSLEQAGEKTRETIHENAPKVERELSAAGRKIEAATEKTVDRTKQAVHDMKDDDKSKPASK